MSRKPTTPRMLDGYVWTVLQALENCRLGLRDATARDAAAAEAWCTEVYANERPRLAAIVAAQSHLSPSLRADMELRVDDLIRRVLLPGYTRVASAFTLRERERPGAAVSLQTSGLHHLAWIVVALVIGFAAMRAPFLPLWSKGWLLLFGVAGGSVPSAIAWLRRRRYAGELDALASAVNDEVFRLEVDYASRREAAEDPASEDGSALAPARTRVR